MRQNSMFLRASKLCKSTCYTRPWFQHQVDPKMLEMSVLLKASKPCKGTYYPCPWVQPQVDSKDVGNVSVSQRIQAYAHPPSPDARSRDTKAFSRAHQNVLPFQSLATSKRTPGHTKACSRAYQSVLSTSCYLKACSREPQNVLPGTRKLVP